MVQVSPTKLRTVRGSKLQHMAYNGIDEPILLHKLTLKSLYYCIKGLIARTFPECDIDYGHSPVTTKTHTHTTNVNINFIAFEFNFFYTAQGSDSVPTSFST